MLSETSAPASAKAVMPKIYVNSEEHWLCESVVKFRESNDLLKQNE